MILHSKVCTARQRQRSRAVLKPVVSVLLQLVSQSSFAAALDKMCSDTEDDRVECLESELKELSAFSRAVPDCATACQFTADDDMQVAAHRNNAAITGGRGSPTPKERTLLATLAMFPTAPTACDLASAFSMIRHCSGTVSVPDFLIRMALVSLKTVW